jgi:predicted nucleotidyltransferase
MQKNLLDELTEKLNPIFSQDKRIVCAYLFGSSVQGLTHKRSDIDLAILLEPRRTKTFGLDELLGLEVKVTQALSTERYDLVVCNSVSLILKFRIISTGKLIYNINDDLRCEFEEKTMQEYYDFLPRLNEFNREYFAALKEESLK